MAIYSDLNSSSPTTNPLVYDFEAVNQALINLFNTRPGEVLFNPLFGLDLEEDLFEIIDEISSIEIFNRVTLAIRNFEPRVRVDTSRTQVIPVPSQNRFELRLVFNLVGLSDPQQFTVIGSFSQ